MDENPVPKADGLKAAEIVEAARAFYEGGAPVAHPIRKRAFHRALKRKEKWALHQKSMHETLDMFRAMVVGYFVKQCLKENPLLKLAKRNP